MMAKLGNQMWLSISNGHYIKCNKISILDDIKCAEFVGTFVQTFQVASTMQQMDTDDAEIRIIDELNEHTEYQIHYSMVSIEQQSFGRIKMQSILDMFKNKVMTGTLFVGGSGIMYTILASKFYSTGSFISF